MLDYYWEQVVVKGKERESEEEVRKVADGCRIECVHTEQEEIKEKTLRRETLFKKNFSTEPYQQNTNLLYYVILHDLYYALIYSPLHLCERKLDRHSKSNNNKQCRCSFSYFLHPSSKVWIIN